MPLFEYVCNHCAERVEILQKFSEQKNERCPKCDGEMRKLVSSPAIQFKGSGFYKNDYASSPATKSESSGESKSESKTESKTDTKPESKTDAKTETTTTTSSGSKSSE